MVKEDISIKQKGIYYPPEIKYFEFDTEPHILANTAETNMGSVTTPGSGEDGYDEDFFTKSLSYDPAWGDDEE